MLYDEIPIVEISLRGMGKQLVGHFALYQDNIEAEVKRAIEKAVREFDFGLVVTEQARAAIQASTKKAVSDYFGFGEGKKLIERMVERAMQESIR